MPSASLHVGAFLRADWCIDPVSKPWWLLWAPWLLDLGAPGLIS